MWRTRSNASSGVWVGALIPLACCPGLYAIHSQCRPSPSVLAILGIQVGISSLHILYDLHHKNIKMAENQNPELPKSWFLYLITHRYLPVIVSFVAFIIFSVGGIGAFISSVVCCALQQQLTYWIFDQFGNSFSIGEGLFVGQAGSLTFALSIKGLLNLKPSVVASENKRLFIFVQVAIIVSSLFGYLLWKWRGRLTFWRFLLMLGVLGAAGVTASSVMIRTWSPSWLIHMILSPTRIALVGWWSNVTVLIILTAAVSQRYPHIPRTVLRKTFHILMAFIYVPGIILDPTLTYFASTVAMILFILLEIIRTTGIEPFSSLFNSTFYAFLDEKDTGSLVLSHIYLVGGLSLPLWLYPCDFLQMERIQLNLGVEDVGAMKVQFLVFPLLAGVLSVGVGDTAASIGGTYIGRHKFPGSRKTVEGSLCSFISQVTFVTVLVYLGSMNIVWSSWPRLIAAIIINVLVEAFTDQVDNIVLPLLLYIPFMDP